MRPSRFLLAAVPALGLAGVVVACTEEGPATDVGLVMLAPEGLLGDATSVKLSVFDASASTCDPTTGSAGTIPTTAQSFTLKKEGCDTGKWCGQITLDKNGAKKIFAVDVRNDSGLLGQGCTTAVINQDPLDVNIKVVRYVAPACCGDGALQVGELCDPGGSTSCGGVTADEVCLADCTVAELPIDRSPTDPAPATGTESGVSIAFVGGNGQLQNGLRAAFELAAAGGSDIAIDFRKSDMSHVTTPQQLAAPLRIPLKCSNPSAAGQARQQRTPSIAAFDASNSIVVFTSDEVLPNNFNLYYSSLGADGCAAAGPVRLNTTDNGVTEPRVAIGPGGVALVVWSQNGDIKGRTVDAAGTLGTEVTIATGKGPKVAGNASGWVVAYEGSGAGDDDGIFMKKVSASGTAGAETLVNAKTAGAQDQPDVSLRADGRLLVTFHSDSDVYFQRFDASGAAVAGDQGAPLNSSTAGEQANPAAATGAGDYFVVAWENQATGEIWARYVGGSSGFVFNSVNGQNSDFLASASSASGARRKPSVAVGGDGWIVMAWEDQSPSHTGIFLRRFPLPQ